MLVMGVAVNVMGAGMEDLKAAGALWSGRKVAEAEAAYSTLASSKTSTTGIVEAAQYMLGHCLRAQGKEKEAVRTFESLFSSKDTLRAKRAHGAIGEIHESKGRINEARREYEAMLPVLDLPMDARVRVRLAGLLRKQGQREDANKALMGYLLEKGRIDAWGEWHQAIFDAIEITSADQQVYRKFCDDLNFLVLPVEANVAIKTMLKRYAEGQ